MERVLITGASSGMGKSMAYYLHSLGNYELVLVARSKDKLEKIKNELGNNVEIISLDLGIYDNCIKIHEMVKDVDILINNAGFGLFGEFIDVDLDKEMEMININIKALHVLTKLYLRDMVKKDKGRILNVASIAGFMPGPLLDTYYASKNYVVSICQSIKEELRRKKSKVSISVLCPGPVKTNFDDVAGVSFSLKGMDSDYVAKYAIDRMLKNKFIIIPGLSIKALRFISKVVPDCLLVRMVYNSQKRKGS
ncbi:MAG: SDR family oxidoreductase [Bacilli bacterium]|nr:SDR family oxidoreductase [Bacilli bacterium]